MTVTEIKAKLDELGIEYPADAKKAELEALLPAEEAPVPAEEAPESAEEAPVSAEEASEAVVKAKVVRAFCDIHTLEDRKVGDVIEVTEKRFAEINVKRQYVVLA